MKKDVPLANELTRFRKVTGTCYAIQICFDQVTIDNVKQIVQDYIRNTKPEVPLSVTLDANEKKGPVVKIGPLPPNEEMMDYLEIPQGDYLLVQETGLKHLTYKSFHAIWEKIPNGGGPGIKIVSETTFNWKERIRILFGMKFHSISSIDVDVPVSIIHTEERCYVDPIFGNKQRISVQDCVTNDPTREKTPQGGTEEKPSTAQG